MATNIVNAAKRKSNYKQDELIVTRVTSNVITKSEDIDTYQRKGCEK